MTSVKDRDAKKRTRSVRHCIYMRSSASRAPGGLFEYGEAGNHLNLARADFEQLIPS